MQQNHQSSHLSQTTTLSDEVPESALQANKKRAWGSPKIDEMDYDKTQSEVTARNGSDLGYYS